MHSSVYYSQSRYSHHMSDSETTTPRARSTTSTVAYSRWTGGKNDSANVNKAVNKMLVEYHLLLLPVSSTSFRFCSNPVQPKANVSNSELITVSRSLCASIPQPDSQPGPGPSHRRRALCAVCSSRAAGGWRGVDACRVFEQCSIETF